MSLGWGDGTWSSGPWGGGTVYPTGNEANGFVGVVSPELIIALSGVLASGSVGDVSETNNPTEDGNVAFGNVASTQVHRIFNSATINAVVAAGTYAEFRIDTPAWATNPTNVSGYWILVIESE
jgi:hypothetical protein